MFNETSSQKIAAIVVGFFPNLNVLDHLLITVLHQVNHLILVDNGGSEAYLQHFPEQRKQVEYINLGENKGLGFALNEGFKLATNYGCHYVATFDQDSAPSNSMIRGLLNTHLLLEKQGINCAAVAPIFYDRRESRKIPFPLYREIDGKVQTIAVSIGSKTSELIDVDVMITSGMLIKASVWLHGIKYYPHLIVDHTDTDWCFRAKEAGFKLFIDSKEEMEHALSDAPPRRIFALSFFTYSPLRRYYFFRNAIFLTSQNYVSIAWKKRIITGLFIRYFFNFLTDKNRLATLKMMNTGIYHGLSGRYGLYK